MAGTQISHMFWIQPHLPFRQSTDLYVHTFTDDAVICGTSSAIVPSPTSFEDRVRWSIGKLRRLPPQLSVLSPEAVRTKPTEVVSAAMLVRTVCTLAGEIPVEQQEVVSPLRPWVYDADTVEAHRVLALREMNHEPLGRGKAALDNAKKGISRVPDTPVDCFVGGKCHENVTQNQRLTEAYRYKVQACLGTKDAVKYKHLSEEDR